MTFWEFIAVSPFWGIVFGMGGVTLFLFWQESYAMRGES